MITRKLTSSMIIRRDIGSSNGKSLVSAKFSKRAERGLRDINSTISTDATPGLGNSPVVPASATFTCRVVAAISKIVRIVGVSTR
jgi:hypothetical protein